MSENGLDEERRRREEVGDVPLSAEGVEQLQASGMTLREIAAMIGVSYQAVRKALDPEGHAEEMRRTNARRREAKRAWADEHDRAPCPSCGALMVTGALRKGVLQCEACRRASDEARIRERAEQIHEWWITGESLKDIAKRLGWSLNHLGSEIHRIRRRWPELIPLRYRVNR